MPQYKVIATGFYNGKLYDPDGKRRVLDVDKPFNKKNMPKWVSEMPKESDAVKKKREAQEASRNAIDADKVEQDQKDIADASFLGDGEKGSAVETI